MSSVPYFLYAGAIGVGNAGDWRGMASLSLSSALRLMSSVGTLETGRSRRRRRKKVTPITEAIIMITTITMAAMTPALSFFLGAAPFLSVGGIESVVEPLFTG